MMTTSEVPVSKQIREGQRPRVPRVIRGPDGRPRVVRRGLEALAAMQANLPKVLRIGMIQGSRIVEERVVRERETVWVGPSEKNHFVVPTESVASRHPLFELRDEEGSDRGRYFLTFDDSMKGRVAFPADRGGTMDFDALRITGRAVRTSKGWQVPLHEQCRGKVVIGETTLLFQFVVPPPIQPKPQLPASVRSGWLSRLEVGMMICLGVSAAVHTGMMTATMVPDWPKPTLDEILASDWAQMPMPVAEADLAPDDVPADEVPTKAVEPGGDEPGAVEPGNVPSDAPAEPASEGPKPPRDRGQRSAQPTVTVDGRTVSVAAYNAQQAGVRNALSADNILGAVAGGVGMGETFAGQSGTVGNLNDSIAQMAGTADGPSQTSGYTTMAGTLDGANVGELGQDGPQGPVTTPGRDVAVAVEPGTIEPIGVVRVLRPGRGDGPGRMERDVFMRVFQRKVRGIEQCYNNALPRDPTLEGDLTFLITINMQGGVSLSIEQDSTALRAAGVTECIESKLLSMNFASTPPVGGAFQVRQGFSFIPP